MKKFAPFLAALTLLFFATGVFAEEHKLRWDPNTESDLAGYKLYYCFDSPTNFSSGTGAVQGNSPIITGLVTETPIDIPSFPSNGKVLYFTLTAFNTSGLEGPQGNIVVVYPGDMELPTLGETAPP